MHKHIKHIKHIKIRSAGSLKNPGWPDYLIFTVPMYSRVIDNSQSWQQTSPSLPKSRPLELSLSAYDRNLLGNPCLTTKRPETVDLGTCLKNIGSKTKVNVQKIMKTKKRLKPIENEGTLVPLVPSLSTRTVYPSCHYSTNPHRR